MGAPLSPAEQARVDLLLAPARNRLDEVRAGAAWAEGQALTLSEAIAHALGEDAGNREHGQRGSG